MVIIEKVLWLCKKSLIGFNIFQFLGSSSHHIHSTSEYNNNNTKTEARRKVTRWGLNCFGVVDEKCKLWMENKQIMEWGVLWVIVKFNLEVFFSKKFVCCFNVFGYKISYVHTGSGFFTLFTSHIHRMCERSMNWTQPDLSFPTAHLLTW